MVALVDDEDYDYINQWKWYANKIHRTYYAMRRRYTTENGPLIRYMHREIMEVDIDKQIDHKDGDGLNNQRENLRICTCAENSHNMRKFRGKSSKYKGVSVDKNGYITAYFYNNSKSFYIGRFKTEESAAKAYDKMAREYYGEFANLNFK